MTIELWLSFLLAASALLWLPGPTFALTISYALNFGRVSACFVAPAVALGYVVSMTITVMGASALLVISAELFAGLKLLGAIYLVWLGVQFWRSNGRLPQEETTVIGKRKSIFVRAFVSTAMSPKGVAAGAALAPQFITVSTPIIPQLIIMEASFVCLAAVNVIIWTMFADQLGRHFNTKKRLRTIDRASGTIMIGAGIALGASHKI